MTTFRLGIKLGNVAMQTPQDVADALREAAFKLDSESWSSGGAEGQIRDANGNTVGTWEVAG